MSGAVVLQTAFLGDMILTTPLLDRLAQDGPVHVVATPASAPLLTGHPAVRSVIVFDKRRADRGWRGMRRVARAVRATGATTAYLAQGSLRTAAIAWMAGLPTRIGFATSPGRVLSTRSVPFDRTLHHAQRLWQLASTVTEAGAPPALRPSLHPSPDDDAQVGALLAASGVSPDAPLVALAPGSVWHTKRWPDFADAAVRLAEALQNERLTLVVIGGADDAPLAQAIAAAVAAHGAAPVINATGRLSLLASAALLRRSRVLVTNDSAPLHLASAMNTPTVALFGPTVPAFGFGPLATTSRVVEVPGLSCRPCGAHGGASCPAGHWRCMRDIRPEAVAEAAARIF